MPEPAAPAAVSVLVQGAYLIASVRASLSDSDLVALRDQIGEQVGESRSVGVILDLAGLDVIDSFTVHTLQELARVVALRGAVTVLVGIRPDVAYAVVQWGLTLSPIATALDLDAGLAYLRRQAAPDPLRHRCA